MAQHDIGIACRDYVCLHRFPTDNAQEVADKLVAKSKSRNVTVAFCVCNDILEIPFYDQAEVSQFLAPRGVSQITGSSSRFIAWTAF